MASTVVVSTDVRYIDGHSHANADNLKAAALEDLFDGVGSYSDLKVSARGAGANMSVDVAPGSFRVAASGGVGTGAYRQRVATITNIDGFVAPGGTNNRIDLIVAQVRDDGANFDAVISKVTGTPAAPGSEVAPAAPATSIILAQIKLTPTTSSVTAGAITDKRQPMHRVAIVGATNHPQYQFGGGLQPGQGVIDYETGQVRTRADGDGPTELYSTTAGYAHCTGLQGSVVGDLPDNAFVADLLFQFVNQAVHFNDSGQGRITLPNAFPNGVLGFITLGTSNSGGTLYSRRTEGAPADLGSVIIMGLAVSPTSGIQLIKNDDRTVAALVLGW